MSFDALPNELIHKISALGSSPELISLCLTSRRLHSQSILSLYWTVELRRPVHIMKWCRAVRLRPGLADLTRVLGIRCDQTGLDVFSAFFTALRATVPRLRNLQTLVMHSSRNIVRTFYDVHFPDLTRISCVCCDYVFTFAQNHGQTLSVLEIRSSLEGDTDFALDAGYSSTPSAPPGGYSFPLLRRLAGSIDIAAELVPNSAVQDLEIYWPSDPDFISNNLPDLQRISRSSECFNKLYNVVRRWDASLVSALADHFNNMETLVFDPVTRNSQGFTPGDIQDIVAALEEHLPRFERLKVLTLRGREDYPLEQNVDTLFALLDEEFAVLRSWSGRTATMYLAILPLTGVLEYFGHLETATALSEQGLPSPTAMHPEAMLLLRWFLTWLATTQDDADTQAYLSFAIVTLGYQGCDELRRRWDAEGRIPPFELNAGSLHRADVMSSRIKFLD
ncbi:hypothetical protein MKEN_00540100 [Mycena kentingensis (nom. inval.)]|nr:hypothetical protein MKEN_00540100 [Mycena kentingensis (nom. inval.)]